MSVLTLQAFLKVSDKFINRKEFKFNFQLINNKANFGKLVKKKPLPPNYFMCIRLTNNEVFDSFKSLFYFILNREFIFLLFRLLEWPENVKTRF